MVGSDVTLIRNNLVNESCKLKGLKVMLYASAGQPFTAQLAVVDVNTTYYKEPMQVNLVSYLSAETQLIYLAKYGHCLVTRSMLQGFEEDRTVEVSCQCEDEDKKEVSNNSIELENTYQRDDIIFATN
ncbi:hypothetical protein ACJMK2_005313 [Sinanodonta woodiana]|uniref:Uncharacterized protein n=1 Tax=Sinanodonta woodiana TaxID=1069815 RepID=A0ABD3VQ14_SINWO